jgi:hypothetical protein
MPANDLKKMPVGQVSYGAGKLSQATLARVDYSNGARLTHSLRFSPSGIVIGNREVGGAIDIQIDEDGLERDWINLAIAGTVKQCRFEIPQQEIAIIIVLTRIELEMRNGDAVTLRVAFVGKIEA